jgi:hypothetical protein
VLQARAKDSRTTNAERRTRQTICAGIDGFHRCLIRAVLTGFAWTSRKECAGVQVEDTHLRTVDRWTVAIQRRTFDPAGSTLSRDVGAEKP